jgi:histone deacetylase 1/2
MYFKVDLPATLEIPPNEFYDYFGPTFDIGVLPSNMENLNTAEYVQKIRCDKVLGDDVFSFVLFRAKVIENLRHAQFAPSVQLQGNLSHMALRIGGA